MLLCLRLKAPAAVGCWENPVERWVRGKTEWIVGGICLWVTLWVFVWNALTSFDWSHKRQNQNKLKNWLWGEELGRGPNRRQTGGKHPKCTSCQCSNIPPSIFHFPPKSSYIYVYIVCCFKLVELAAFAVFVCQRFYPFISLNSTPHPKRLYPCVHLSVGIPHSAAPPVCVQFHFIIV